MVKDEHGTIFSDLKFLLTFS